ncbi:hypothetical protein M8523_28245 [Hyphomicrobiales bacterium BP6-180914]|uniref:Uncharacterized protein n=1 Tax=Lichenifustis flavocetrariae TaxID=2949735 RepID=A0AA42CLQ0_9HYPH|nr:hypothetical protein [Lichenifustis flavocetrariae]
MSLITGAAQASTIVEVSGVIQGRAFTSQLNLDVVGNQALSGTGTFTGYGLTNADLVLITTSTSYNETIPGPVGFRGNDGTDFGGLDQAYPILTNGLLFDVGTTTASFGAFPLFAVYSNGNGTYGAASTGNVGGTGYYAQLSSSEVSVSVGTVSLPASAPMFGAALMALGVVGYGMKRNAKAHA